MSTKKPSLDRPMENPFKDIPDIFDRPMENPFDGIEPSGNGDGKAGEVPADLDRPMPNPFEKYSPKPHSHVSRIWRRP